MKKTLLTLCAGMLALALFVPVTVRAQRAFSAGSIIIDDGAGHALTLLPPVSLTGNMSFQFPLPPVGATPGFVSLGTATGQILVWNGAAGHLDWEPSTTLPAISGANLTNLNASNLTSGTVGTARLGTGTADATTFLRGDGSWSTPSSTPGGTAGGDLTGTYPNPTIGSGAVTSAKILDGTIVDADINASAAIAYSKIAGTPTSLPPSGTAGGNLGGTYPNPTIASLPAISGASLTNLNAGNIASGTVAVANGGTGATTAAAALSTLGAAPATRTITAGTGLSGGGDLSADRTIALANTAVTPGSYTNANVTVDAQGRLTSAVSGTGGSGGVPTTRTITAGTGLSGGGDLSADRTISLDTSNANTWTGVQTLPVNATQSDNLVACINAGNTVVLHAAEANVATQAEYSIFADFATNATNANFATNATYAIYAQIATNAYWARYADFAGSAGDVTGTVAIANGGTGATTDSSALSALGATPVIRTIATGTGLSGGGDLSADMTIALANTAVTAGSYTNANITVDAQGRLTAAGNGTVSHAPNASTAPASPQAGDFYFNTGDNHFYGYNGTTWKQLDN